jgi:CoA:oxalate CoA-transferase
VTGFATMAGRTARRAEVLAVVAEALAADTADNWEQRLRRAGVPAAAVRDLASALAGAGELLAEAGGYRLVGNPVRIDGYRPAYAGPPRLGEHGDLVEER